MVATTGSACDFVQFYNLHDDDFAGVFIALAAAQFL